MSPLDTTGLLTFWIYPACRRYLALFMLLMCGTEGSLFKFPYGRLQSWLPFMASPHEITTTMLLEDPVETPDSQRNNQLDYLPALTEKPDSQTVNPPAIQPEKPGTQTNNPPDKSPDSNTEPSPGQNGDGVPGSGPSIQDILALCGILVMLIWPWIFFGVVFAKDGLQMNNDFAKVVTDNAHVATYFVTLICAVISMIISALFSLAIIRFAQELVTYQEKTQPFHLNVLLAFRHQNWPWGKSAKDARYLLTKDRWWPTALVVACFLTFPQLISSTTSLITPGPFNRTAVLTGTELDFSSTAADCLAWFDAHPLTSDCDYVSFNGLKYTNCLGQNQMVDVLEAGRGDILELLSNNSESLSFSQLGSQDGLRFLGSIRGILPIGPNGVPAFDTLRPSPFSNPHIVEGMTSYNYTLNLQGLASNVSCIYEPTSHLTTVQVYPGNPMIVATNANCTAMGQTEVLTGVQALTTINGNDSLTCWACQSAPNGTQPPSYFIYFQGGGSPTSSYRTGIGNMTCTINPIRPAVIPVTYQSTERIFSAAEPITSSPIKVSTFLNHAMVGLTGVVAEAQGFQTNLVAESVITYGIKSFQLDVNHQTDQYLRLYERMIQGMIEYQTTYLRLIYSTAPGRPDSCTRTVNGTVSYQVIGWFVTIANIGLLIPMTLINVAAFVALLLAMIKAKTGGYQFPPSQDRPVKLLGDDPEAQVPDEWKEKVAFRATTLVKEYFESTVKGELQGGVRQASEAVTMKIIE